LREKDELVNANKQQASVNEGAVEKIRELEKENSELKAKQLMSQFGQSKPKSTDQVQQLKMQLSEKTNEILRLKDQIVELKQEKENSEGNPFGETT